MDFEISLQVNGAAHWLSVDTRATLLVEPHVDQDGRSRMIVSP